MGKMNMEWMLAVRLAVLWRTVAWAYLIASSRLETCTDTGSARNCTSPKLITTLSLDNDQFSGTETLEAYITTASTASDTNAALQFPIKITAAKSQVTARYPLRYQRDFNARVRELVLSQSAFDCTDEAYSSHPTCGWKEDSSGSKIWDSQGYCCTCSLLQTVGLDPDSYTRGNQCEAFNLGDGYATAHCLVMDSLWYSAYQVGAFSVSYEIEVRVTFPDENGNYTLSTMRLSPSQGVQQVAGVVGRLVGDFYPTTPPPVLESLLLFTPSQPADNSRVLMGSRRWLLIDKTKVSYDGTECNKVGTSYSAFNNQANKCGQRVQSCFQNQLEDFDSSDLKAVNAGKAPQYFLSTYGNFTNLLWQDEKYLQVALSGKFSSMITLEMTADRLVFLTSVSTGRIDYAYINSFESMTYDGILTAQVTSTGAVVAQFSLTVNCSQGIAQVPAALFSLPPQRSVVRTAAIHTERLTGSEYNCSVNLWDAVGSLLETLTISFNTTTRHTDLGPQGGTGPLLTGDNVTDADRRDLTCTDYCPNWFDLPCFFAKSCWTSFLRFLGILLLFFVTVVTVKFVVRRYGCCCQRLCREREKQSGSEVAVKSPRREKREETPSPTFWGKAHVYYNFHYGIPELGVYQQFSARGTVRPAAGGDYEFTIGDEELRRFIREKKPGSDVLVFSADEAYTNVSDKPFYGQYQPAEATTIEAN